jgi:UDP-N-acetyl-D-galactosamine dehydrogenase
MMHDLGSVRIAVIGLGYVGLPLAVEFAKYFPVVGFDHNLRRIDSLKAGFDATLELSDAQLSSANQLQYSSEIADLKSCNIYIVTVPTPIDDHKNPDIRLLLEASKTVGSILDKGDIVIYESTVYPGATEEDCVPVIEAHSGLKLNHDFYVGYSPERINPGDKLHRLPDIKKVTSGSTPEVARYVDLLYQKIINAGTHMAPSIRVAEAAKVIENTQRDLNIALINELAIIFNKMQIDTEAVLQAAGTKWNFLPFRPGLVGGHCIGVDPYYLTHKAQSIGYRSEVILAGRRLNDSMGSYVASQLIKSMSSKGIQINSSSVLILGATFKENCPDVRNSKVFDVASELEGFGCEVVIYDPWIDVDDISYKYNGKILSRLENEKYDGIILAVAHQHFKDLGSEKIRLLGKPNHVLYDLKYIFDASNTDLRL